MTTSTGPRLDPRIAPTFVDAWGHNRPVAEATLSALTLALQRVPAVVPSPVQVHPVSQGPLQFNVPAGYTHWQLVLDASAEATVGADVANQAGALAAGQHTLSLTLPLGYHELLLRGGADQPVLIVTLIGVPDRCYLPPLVAEGKRCWGVALQLYTVRSARNWGIGDFTDLQDAARRAAKLGADLIGLNPLHALYPANPRHISPYSPNHREFLNWLYLDPEAVPEFAEASDAHALIGSGEFQQQLAAARATEAVDYAAVAALKRPVLERLYVAFQQAATSQRRQAFAEFIAQGSDDLQRHALFDALHEHVQQETGEVREWQRWPVELQRPDSADAQAFAANHADRLQFFCWLQWLAEQQLEAAQQACIDAGMRIGLYRDLAVGADRGGSEIWSSPDLFCQDISVGAPPDALAVQGQNWGLPPMHPEAMRADRYHCFTSMLRANMRHCGALRIDHVMALFRLWWIPSGGTGADGAYVHYPLADIAGIVALESQRQQCLVIGEDLGTVPEEIRRLMHTNQMLSYRILMFEQHHDRLKSPSEYPPLALCTISTHDMATLPGFWVCDDIELRDQIGLFDRPEQKQQQYDSRHADKHKLLQALKTEHLLDRNPAEQGAYDDELMRAAHAYLARSQAVVMMVQPEDWLGEVRQVNMPGTSTENPNWQRKLAEPIEQMFGGANVTELAQIINKERKG